jgi:hypothetical protein
MSDDAIQAPRQLPLWRHFITTMNDADALKFGAFFTTSDMEQHLGCKEDTAEFGMSIHRIRRALRRAGKNFTARGQLGEGFVIAPPDTNRCEMQRLQAAAITAMREGVVLGTNTPLELLSAEARRKHEAILEKMAMRLALVNRRTPELKSPRIEKPDTQ